MKKSVVRIGFALIGLVLILGTMTALAVQPYSDLAPNHWCYKKIIEFVDKGYIQGYEDGTMRPDKTITRAEYVKVVNNFFGFKVEKTTKKFDDVSDDAWYTDYVYTAVAEGYISGYDDNTFRPESPITRQEATVILSRILKIDKEEYPQNHKDGLAQYSDGNEVADWAYTAIHSYSVYNFINGYEDGTLRILQNVTRAETVELLHVLEQKIEIDRSYSNKKTTKMPTINVIVETKKDEFMPATTVNDWYNKENSCYDKDGIYVNMTTTTNGATIYEKVNPREPADRSYVTTNVDNFTNKFFLADGIYDVSAYAQKAGSKTSGTNSAIIKVDTVAPNVEAEVLNNGTNPASSIAHTQRIKVTLKDVIPSGLTEDKVSGVNDASAKYAWFIESGESFAKVGDWTSFSNEQIIEAPAKYGKYKLAVSVKDNAENSFGTKLDGEIKYDFAKERKAVISEEAIVEVENNAPQVENLTLSTKLGIVASGDIVAFDSDSGDKLTYTLETKPTSGDVVIDALTGRIVYTPNEKGIFTFTVKVSDGNESGDTITTVTVSVEDLNYTVNYYLKGTTTKLATSKFVDNQFFSTKILATDEAIAIDGYNYDSSDKEELIIGLDENVMNLYYTKRTDLSYTVNYLEKGTDKVLAPAKVVENQTFGDKITETAIEIDGYNKVAPTSGEVEITTGTNEITFYYEKRTDLSYTVNYYLENTTTKVATSKTVDGKTFEEEVTENAIDVAGYTKVTPTTKTLKISANESENVINFYYEKKEGNLIVNIECNYPTKDGTKAEPGDTLEYIITLDEPGEAVVYPKTLTIKLDADVVLDKPTSLPLYATYDEATHTITWNVNSKTDKLTYNTVVKKEISAGTKVKTTIKGERVTKVTGAKSVDVEVTVKVKTDKNKNIILVLDVSSSMKGNKLKVMKEAAKSFAKSIIDERNSEDITITIITFSSTATDKGTLLNPEEKDVNLVINSLETNNGTNIKDAIQMATKVLNNKSMLENAVDYVIVLSDGDPYKADFYCDTNTLNVFYKTNANAFAIGFGNSYKKTELLKIVNNDEDRLFDAADADKLEDAFKKIGFEINKEQTVEGEIDVDVAGIELYPIYITYNNVALKTVNITINGSGELAENNLSIAEEKLVWNISQYPSCTDFQIKVNRTKISTKNEASGDVEVEEPVSGENETKPTVSKSGDTEVEEPVSGENETKPTVSKSGDTEVEEPVSGENETKPTVSKSGNTEVEEPVLGENGPETITKGLSNTVNEEQNAEKETKQIAKEAVVPEIKDPIENEEKDEEAA